MPSSARIAVTLNLDNGTNFLARVDRLQSLTDGRLSLYRILKG